MPVTEVLERMTATELGEWQAYEAVTGTLGPERLDHLSAVQTYHLMLAAGVKRSKIRVDKLSIRWDRAPQDWRDMRTVAIALAEATGGTVTRPSPAEPSN